MLRENQFNSIWCYMRGLMQLRTRTDPRLHIMLCLTINLQIHSCLGLGLLIKSPFFFFCSCSCCMCIVYSLAACQCNGHSQCVNESVCEKCEDLTTGRHCESCISGYYGDPTNGGSCQCEYP